MRVLFLSPGAYAVNGGIGLYGRDIAEGLVENDPHAEVEILQRQGCVEPPPPDRRITIDGKSSNGFITFVLASLRRLFRRYDLIICGHIFLLPLAVVHKVISGAPLVLLIYGIDVWDNRKKLSTALLGFCTSIWSISEITRDRMNDWAKLPASKYGLLPNAIHLERYSDKPEPKYLRERLGVGGKTVLLTLTRLPGFDRYKGVDEMLEILPRLTSEFPGIAYVVAGDGDDRPRLEDKAKSLGIADHVVFSGYVKEEEKADFYRMADGFVLPGRGEGFGFVFLEALACGTPVLGSVLDGSREALRDGELGILVDPRDGEAVFQGTKKLLACKKGIPDGLDYFAWSAFKDRLLALTRAACGGVAK